MESIKITPVDEAYKKYVDFAGKLEEPDYDLHVEDIENSRIRLMEIGEFVLRICTIDEFYCKFAPECDGHNNYVKNSGDNDTSREQFSERVKSDPDFRSKWCVGYLIDFNLDERLELFSFVYPELEIKEKTHNFLNSKYIPKRKMID
jgi:hypothetical protein